MPLPFETKAVDPEAEYSNAHRTFLKLSTKCSIANKSKGIPELAPKIKQMDILKKEMDETLLCIDLAKSGRHAARDVNTKQSIKKSINEYENWKDVVRDERLQETELDIMNYIAQKKVQELSKKVPTEADELAMIEDAMHRLRRMENRLDIATKRFCLVNADNKQIRAEINRLLVERNNFNVQWNRIIRRLVKGKEYLMDILEIASVTFSNRDKACTMLQSLKWKGLYQLNKDIAEMQYYDSEINHLAKLEEFLRVKGTKRYCEADEKEEIKKLDEIARCEEEIAWHDRLLADIFAFAGSEYPSTISENFNQTEIENFAKFVYLCEIMQQSIVLRKDLDLFRHSILDQHDINQAREEKHNKRLSDLTVQLNEQNKRNSEKQQLNMYAEEKLQKLLKAIDDLFRIAKCDNTPVMSLLGNHMEVTKWNVYQFLKILEVEVKSLIQVVYGAVRPPSATPTAKVKHAFGDVKIVADPHIEVLRPNKIEILVPYQPCAYCVEDYIMNLVYETPAVPADDDYINAIFHLEDVNTKFGIFTLTVPGKRHPYRNKNKGD